jgi:predicted nucleic acid-binding protein
MDILADTGVILRLYDQSDPWHSDAVRSVNTLKAQGERNVVASQNIREFWNTCTRPTSARNGLGLSLAETNRRVISLENLYAIIVDDPASYPIWKQLVFHHSVKGKQVHDANLVALMMAHGINHILTFNGPDFSRYPGITAIDPRTV